MIRTASATRGLLVATALAGTSMTAQESPLQYGSVAVADCGKVGQLLQQSTGTGTRAGRTTQYASAAFEIDCDGGHVGQVDIQTADNEAPIVTYRLEKGASDGQPITGPEVRPLVEQSIRTVCSCALP